jgi:LPXTG-motif cell wall-anchored protein
VGGSTLSDHADNEVIVCIYTGSLNALASGDSMSVTYSANVTGYTDHIFTTYASNFSTPDDPDRTAFDNAVSSGNDIISELDGNINNIDRYDFIPTTDVGFTMALDDPQDVASGATITYTVTLTNYGPDPIDLASYPGGSNPFTEALFGIVLPPDLHIGTSLTPNVDCVDFAPATVVGAVLGSHSTYEIISCNYTGTSTFVNAGESVAITFSAAVDPSSDLQFTSYLLNASIAYDTDWQNVVNVATSGSDVLDALDPDVNNMAFAQYPIPVPTPSTTTTVIPAPNQSGVAGELANTGSNPWFLLAIAFSLGAIGFLLARRRRFRFGR